LDRVRDEDGDGAANIDDVKIFLKRNKAARKSLKGDSQYAGGDFRSAECIKLLQESDIVVTNPPFSLFREYVAQLVKFEKKLLIIGNLQALTYQEVFPLIKADKLWMGVSIHSGDREFRVPDHYPLEASSSRIDENGVKYLRVKGVRWYTNLDHGRRHEKLSLMTMEDNLRYSKHKEIKGKTAYARYDNFNAIEVPFTDAIPSDHNGMMGVPITFLDKYNPEQFEILGYEKSYHMQTRKYETQIQVDKSGRKSNVSKLNDGVAVKVDEPPADQTYYVVDGNYYVQQYKRIFIRRRSQLTEREK